MDMSLNKLWEIGVVQSLESQSQTLVEQEQWAATTDFSQFHSFHPAASEEETFVFFKLLVGSQH